MKKFKFFFMDFDKEEKWLMEMAENGYQLCKVGFFYTFDRVEKEIPIIRIDFRIIKKEVDFQDYLALFEDCGWHYITGFREGGRQYFKRVRSDASMDIFSDISSGAKRYKILANMWLSYSVGFLILVMVLLTFSSSMRTMLRNIFNLKDYYGTPGLWTMQGWRFWRQFLFETPFVVVQFIANIALFSSPVLFLICGIKAKRRYTTIENNSVNKVE